MKFSSFFGFLLLLAIVLWLHVMWARYRLREWAGNQGYTVSSSRLCLGRIGPFSYFGTSGGQTIFRIEVIDQEGRHRSGYARVGGFFFGLMRKRVEVKWDRPLIDEMIGQE